MSHFHNKLNILHSMEGIILVSCYLTTCSRTNKPVTLQTFHAMCVLWLCKFAQLHNACAWLKNKSKLLASTVNMFIYIYVQASQTNFVTKIILYWETMLNLLTYMIVPRLAGHSEGIGLNGPLWHKFSNWNLSVGLPTKVGPGSTNQYATDMN